jgi:hypothetical protein
MEPIIKMALTAKLGLTEDQANEVLRNAEGNKIRWKALSRYRGVGPVGIQKFADFVRKFDVYVIW